MRDILRKHPTHQKISSIMQELPEGSPLYRIVVDSYITSAASVKHFREYGNLFPAQFLTDILVGVLEDRQQKVGRPQPQFALRKKYHIKDPEANLARI